MNSSFASCVAATAGLMLVASMGLSLSGCGPAAPNSARHFYAYYIQNDGVREAESVVAHFDSTSLPVGHLSGGSGASFDLFATEPSETASATWARNSGAQFTGVVSIPTNRYSADVQYQLAIDDSEKLTLLVQVYAEHEQKYRTMIVMRGVVQTNLAPTPAPHQ